MKIRNRLIIYKETICIQLECNLTVTQLWTFVAYFMHNLNNIVTFRIIFVYCKETEKGPAFVYTLMLSPNIVTQVQFELSQI